MNSISDSIDNFVYKIVIHPLYHRRLAGSLKNYGVPNKLFNLFVCYLFNSQCSWLSQR